MPRMPGTVTVRTVFRVVEKASEAARGGRLETVIATVAVGDIPLAVAVDAEANRAYVVSAFDDSLSVIDGATHEVVMTVAVGVKPWDLVLASDGSLVYVASSSTGEVRVLETEALVR